ncbi:hypothetical protein HYX17_02950 [Candidatus Woesearchaeota archaeon]|nr:hypothetical protein [Candidatus Woesearchaeota archaeon]
MKIRILIKDLFLKSKTEEIIKSLNHSITFEEDDFDYVIVDLNHKDAFNLIERYPDKCFCFCSHVDKDKIDKAKEIGCKNVYPRSLFFSKLPYLIKTKVH